MVGFVDELVIDRELVWLENVFYECAKNRGSLRIVRVEFSDEIIEPWLLWLFLSQIVYLFHTILEFIPHCLSEAVTLPK